MGPQYQNPYDFIMSNGQQPKKAFNAGGNRTVLGVLFILVVLLVVVIGFAVFSSLTRKDYTVYRNLAEQQTEIVRIADVGLTKARSAATRHYLMTVRSVVTTEKNKTVEFLGKNGLKVTDKDLTGRKNSQTDSALAAAEQTTRYDETLIQTINALMADYRAIAQDASEGSLTKNEQTLLSPILKNAATIAGPVATSNN